MKTKELKVIAVLPAFNAAFSLPQFLETFPKNLFNKIILVDDASKDLTFKIAKSYKWVKASRNKVNLGYGGNMKECLNTALKERADIIVEVHPDGEYGFDGILPAIEKIKKGSDLVLGNRFYKPFSGVKSGMYFWKIPFTKGLTWIGNLVLGTEIPDMHQGFRVYSKPLLEKINYSSYSNDFLFTFEIIVAAVFYNFKISNVPVSSFYKGKKRGVSLLQSATYSLKTFWILFLYLLAKMNLIKTNWLANPNL